MPEKTRSRRRGRRPLSLTTTLPAQPIQWEKLLPVLPAAPQAQDFGDWAADRIMEQVSPGALIVRRISEIMLASPYVSLEGKKGWAVIRAGTYVYAGYKLGEWLDGQR